MAVRLKIRYWYIEKGDTIFVKLSFKLPKQLAEITKKELERKHSKTIIYTPSVQQGMSQSLSLYRAFQDKYAEKGDLLFVRVANPFTF